MDRGAWRDGRVGHGWGTKTTTAMQVLTLIIAVIIAPEIPEALTA